MGARSRLGGPGELAIVLHTHMPYVEGGVVWPPEDMASFLRDPGGFGIWPFGEEWLWEAVAGSYVPLLDLLGRAPITLSLTPVLCDQLEAPGAMDRCLRFFEEVRPDSHQRDIAALSARGEDRLVAEIERSWAEYAAVGARLRELSGDLLHALGRHATWTSAATHPVLPLLASDTAVAVQVQTGIASHRRRFGEWGGGFWLPECAHAGWLHPLLEEAGVRSTCVELTSVFGLGNPRHLRPLASDDGPVLWPVDRATMALVWDEAGYPAAPEYRSYHRLTGAYHRAWRNDGDVYDPDAAAARVRADARDFVARTQERVREGGVCVCALDTELLGHWWYEGVRWLGAVLEEAARSGLALTTLDDALDRHEPALLGDELPVTSWGEGGDLRTWSGPAAADLAWQVRSCELRLLALGRRPPERALRELLALQASDWAFLAARGGAGEYPRERAAAHAAALELALGDDPPLDPSLRGLAPDLTGWVQ